MLTIAESCPEYLFDVKEVTVAGLDLTCSPLGNDGAYEELCFLTAARGRGYTTWVPIGHSQKADAIIWKAPNSPITVQIKRGNFQRGSWHVHIAAARGSDCVARRKAAGRPVDKWVRYQQGDFDVLAVYVPPANAFRLYRLDDLAGQNHLSFRDLSTLNNWHVIEDALKHDL